jgi:hypothetical protein
MTLHKTLAVRVVDPVTPFLLLRRRPFERCQTARAWHPGSKFVEMR